MIFYQDLFNKKPKDNQQILISVFFFLFTTIYFTSLYCIGQKRHKKSLNIKPTKTFSQHLIEIPNHKYARCSKHTLRRLTKQYTLVAFLFCYLCCWLFFCLFVCFIGFFFFKYCVYSLQLSAHCTPHMLSSIGRSSRSVLTAHRSQKCWQCWVVVW